MSSQAAPSSPPSSPQPAPPSSPAAAPSSPPPASSPPAASPPPSSPTPPAAQPAAAPASPTAPPATAPPPTTQAPSSSPSVVFVEAPVPVKEATPLPPPAYPTVTKAATMPVATKGKPLTQAVAEAAPNPPPAAPVVVEAVPAKPADTVTVVQTVVPDDKPAIKVVEPPLAKIVEEARKDMPKPTVVTVVQTDAPVKVADKPVSKDDNVVTVVKAPQPIKASLTIDVKTDKPITDEIKKEDKAVKAEVKKEEKAVKDEIKKEEKAAKQEEKQEQKQIKQVEKEIKKELPKKTSTIVVVASEPVKEPSIVVAEPVVVPKIVPRAPTSSKVPKPQQVEILELDVTPKRRRRDRVRAKIEYILSRLFKSSRRTTGQSPYAVGELEKLRQELELRTTHAREVRQRYLAALRAEMHSMDQRAQHAARAAYSKVQSTASDAVSLEERGRRKLREHQDAARARTHDRRKPRSRSSRGLSPIDEYLPEGPGLMYGFPEDHSVAMLNQIDGSHDDELDSGSLTYLDPRPVSEVAFPFVYRGRNTSRRTRLRDWVEKRSSFKLRHHGRHILHQRKAKKRSFLDK